MKERPILFQGWKVRTIFGWDFDAQGDMQTRRVIKPQPTDLVDDMHEPGKMIPCIYSVKTCGYPCGIQYAVKNGLCPYGKSGDRLWVRETFYHHGKWIKNSRTKTGKQAWKFKPTKHDDGEDVRYMDNSPEIVRPNKYRKPGWYKRPSIFMPRWVSRILLEVTDVRVERVREISEKDSMAEGVVDYPIDEHTTDLMLQLHGLPAQKIFRHLWDSINMKRDFGWDVNPWVWVVLFRRIDA